LKIKIKFDDYNLISKMPSTPPSTPPPTPRATSPPSAKKAHREARQEAHKRRLENELGMLLTEGARKKDAETTDAILNALADVSKIAPFDLRLSVTKGAGTE
jgi:hypothetical protein